MALGTSLSEQQIEAVSYIEQQFWTHGSVPTNDKIAEILSVSVATVAKWWKGETFRRALFKRGIDYNPERSSGVLTPVQLDLANALLNQHDKKSIREKLKELDVSSQQYHAWLRDPRFRDYLSTRAEELFKGSEYEAYSSLLDVVRGGDVSAIKLYFEMRGIYNPRVQVEVNIDMILTRVVEIVAKHVRDPVMLQAIAGDLELLETGQLTREISREVVPALSEFKI